MDQSAPVNPVAPVTTNSNTTSTAGDRRGVWIVTCYAISFLALCVVLAYFFSAYISH